MPNRRATRAIDIFSLGLVFFYVLTKGLHPFDCGDRYMREVNIRKGQFNLKPLEVLGDVAYEAKALIETMLRADPRARPTAKDVMSHPFFWSAKEQLAFLCDVSDHFELEPRDPMSPALMELEACAPQVCRGDFLKVLPKEFVESLGKQRKYTGTKFLDLLRALRNKRSHYGDLSDSLKKMIGPIPDGYLGFWTRRFPNLLIVCCTVIYKLNLEELATFQEYFKPRRPSVKARAEGQSVVASTAPIRRTAKRKEVIVIDSEDSEANYGSDYDGLAQSKAEDVESALPRHYPSFPEVTPLRRLEGSKRHAPTADLPTPQYRSCEIQHYGHPKTPTKKTSDRVTVGDIDRARRRIPNTPSTLAPSSSLDSTYPTGKVAVPPPRHAGSPAKDTDRSNHVLFNTFTPTAPTNNGHCALEKPRSSKEMGEGEYEKPDVKVGVSRHKAVATSIAVAVGNRNAALSRNSSLTSPPMPPPAVKARVYSAARPSSRRNIDIRSKKLEAFGFVSAASLLPRTIAANKWNAGPVTPIPDRQNCTASTVFSPTLILKPKARLESISKHIQQGGVRVQRNSHQPLPHTTQNVATATMVATTTLTSKSIKKEIKQEHAQAQAGFAQPLPRTPEKPRTTKRICTPSHSIGSYGDPYTISSDSDSNGEENSGGRPCIPPALKTFVEITDAHETASDVEAVLNQFPSWLDSPSPTELRSNHAAMHCLSQSTTSARSVITAHPNKRWRDDGVKDWSKEGRENRRVRFDEDGGLGPSPFPMKHTPSSSQSAPPSSSITAPEIQASPARRWTSPPNGSTPPPRRTITLHKARPTLAERMTILDPELEPDKNTSSTMNLDDRNLRAQHERNRKRGQRKKKRKRQAEKKATSRHRNQNRTTWRRKEREKVMKLTRGE
ncbi:hypothetical protein NUW58_g7355 [Xylaria curta]|uniref:Uncharacterized protein n=1 Tax=Xylaria curta TaxID=42375 RepID=A0ACC1NJV3_9PEZI|nr:hypothetical protein NUW58_g7355 [Xylaria curta]